MFINNFIENIIARRNNKNLCKIAMSAYVDAKSLFEGKNFVGSKTRIVQSKFGRGSYVASASSIIKCNIGRYTCIGSNVNIIAGKHPLGFVSMHPFFYTKYNQIGYSYVTKEKYIEHDYVDVAEKYYVKIGNDVWIGSNACIFGGIQIGDGAVIAAGAVVTKDVLPYTIVAGVPAKVIKYRFNEGTINKLCNTAWWSFDETWIKDHADLFSDIDLFLDLFG